MNTTRIVKLVDPYCFRKTVTTSRHIAIGSHALDHLSNLQRKIFNNAGLINSLLREKPALIGLQKNGCYAAFFKRKKGYLKIILTLKGSELKIVTFMNTDTIPNLRGLK